MDPRRPTYGIEDGQTETASQALGANPASLLWEDHKLLGSPRE